MKIRSFLAFELPPVLREGVTRVHGDLRSRLPDMRWVAVGNIHLTVIFLGDVDEKDIAPVGAVACEICRSYGPFGVALKGVGTFGGPRSPRVLWVGLEGDQERLGRFRDDLQERLIPFGVKREARPFRPHLTLGRFREGAKTGKALGEGLREHGQLQSPVAPLNELTLFRSDLRSGGAVYVRLGAWSLAGEK